MECYIWMLPVSNANGSKNRIDFVWEARKIDGRANPVPSPRGGYPSQKKLQAPTNWNMKHYKSVEFLSIFRIPRPPAQMQSPPIENFLATVLSNPRLCHPIPQKLSVVLRFRYCLRTRPATSLGHQVGRRVFWEGPKFFKLCPTHFSREGEKLLGGTSPVWLRACSKPVPSPRGGLAPETKLQAPPNWNMKHYKSVEFLSIFRVSSPPAETQNPPIKNFLASVLLRTSMLVFAVG